GPIHIGLLSIEMVVVFLFLFFAGMSHQAPVTFSFHAVVTGPFAASFWIGLVVVGLAVPLVYNLLAHRTSLAAKLHAPGFVLAESLCVLVGGFMLRYLIVFAGSVGHVFVTIPG
ncbi:MAG: polysulfide reductase NrfD, partial [Propionibacteriaceae bacterium]|nr:polysulfide reductase NrfD [Propionibacteriaceae bacterium]